MISTVRGTVLDIGLDQVVVEVGGLGLAVRTTPGVLAQLHTGTEASLATVLMVRFTDRDTRIVPLTCTDA